MHLRFYQPIIFVLAIFFCEKIFAQDSLIKFHAIQFAGNDLKFQISEVKNNSAPNPLVLFLHGAGERGTDNAHQLKHLQQLFLNCGNNFAADSVLFLAPQCPPDKKWVDINWKDTVYNFPMKFNTQMKFVADAVDSLIQAKQVDRSRMYIVGISMGGFGAMQLSELFTHTFAGIVCICGGVSQHFKNAAFSNIWFFHGADDKLVSPKSVKEFVKNHSRKNLKLTLLPNIGHNAWDGAFSNCELLPWLFRQKKN